MIVRSKNKFKLYSGVFLSKFVSVLVIELSERNYSKDWFNASEQ